MFYIFKIVILVSLIQIGYSSLIDKAKFRLPDQINPSSYALKLQPFIDHGNLTGEVWIHVNVISEVKSIFLHAAHNLTLLEIFLNGNKDSLSYSREPEYELVEIFYKNQSAIFPGHHIIHIKYNASLLHSDGMGLVKVVAGQKNDTEYLIASDFEATYARRAFPCFDEPSFKAIFNISIITPNDTYFALSNMEKQNQQKVNEGILYNFKSSIPMSTYLTSFAVTKLDFMERVYPINNRNITFRAYFKNAKLENDTYVLDFAAKVLAYYENFTKIPSPLNKIDLISYNKKFPATEYWGLTTFNEGWLNPSSSIYDKFQISIVVSHEISHYWFGNLVTNKWWCDIWLQEGFAQYLATKVAEKILNQSYVSYSFQNNLLVFHEDRSIYKSKAVVINVTTPDEIAHDFNDITYAKAGAIIEMLNYLVGEEVFAKILHEFFKQYSYKSASTSDFISVVKDVTLDKNISEFLETWLLQNRYPVVTIVEDTINKVYVLKQQSASLFKNDTNALFGYKWTIPLMYITDIKQEPTLIWFPKDVKILTIPMGKEKVIKFNYKHLGIYYVNYSTNLWDKIINNFDKLPVRERNQLAVEAAQSFFADYIISCEIPLRLAKLTSFASFGSFMAVLSQDLKYDRESYNLLKKYYYHTKGIKLRETSDNKTSSIASISTNIKTENQTQNSTKGLNRTNKENPKLLEIPNKPKRIIECSKWIKEKLKMYF